MTSSNFSQNDGTIRILTHFLAKNHSKLPIASTKIWYCSVVSITLELTCALQVIKLSNERVIALFHYFFLQFSHIAEICQTPQLQDPLSCAFHKYWQLLICILVDLRWVYKSTIRKRSDKKWFRLKGGGNSMLFAFHCQEQLSKRNKLAKPPKGD